MNVEHITITGLEDIDFDDLYSKSLDRLESGNYNWPEGVTDSIEKKEFIRNHFIKTLQLPGSFIYKCVIDGVVVGVHVGYRRGPIQYHIMSLIGPDANNSRAFIYDPLVQTNHKSYLKAQGVEQLWAFIPKSSPIKAGVAQRHSRFTERLDKNIEFRLRDTSDAFLVIDKPDIDEAP